MKVICIDNTRGNARHLETGKVYDASVQTYRHLAKYVGKEYYVIRSTCYSNPTHRVGILPERDIWVDMECFVSLEEYRNKKLESIGI